LNQNLTNKQIASIIFPFITGYGIISLPKNAAKNLGTGGWIVAVIGTIVILFSAFLFIYLAKTFNNKTIFEYSRILTNKFISTIIICIICIYSISSASIVTRLTCEVIKLSFLINTPVWALSLLMIFVIFYALNNEINVLARIFEILTILILVFSTILTIATFSQGKLVNLKPFFYFDMDNLTKTLPSVLFSFIGIEILAVIPMDIKNKNKGIFKYLTLTIVLIGLLYIGAIESCISVMGVESVIHYEDAIFATIRRFEIDFLQFLKRLDLFFIIAWILTTYATIILTLYMSIFLVNKMLVKVKRNNIISITCIITYILSLLPLPIVLFKQILVYISYLGLFILLVLPLILTILSLFKTPKKSNENN
jgi:spore germination protein